MSHNEKRHMEVTSLYGMGPPSSPPIVFERLTNKMRIATAASVQNIVTEKARLKTRTHDLSFCHILNRSFWYIFVVSKQFFYVEMVHISKYISDFVAIHFLP
jgi:hypothetical protein